MSELDDLYAAILADPDSDEPRLVYADALQAAGDPRGELIAIQCEFARLGCERSGWTIAGASPYEDHPDTLDDSLVAIDPTRRLALRDRERALLEAYGTRWWGGDAACRFCRGFVDHVTTSAARIPAMFEQANLLRSISIGDYETTGLAVFEHPRARGLRRLELRLAPESSDAFLERLPELVGLRHLAITGVGGSTSFHTPASAEIIDRFFASPVLAQLEVLDFWQAGATGSHLAQVLETAPLFALRLSATEGSPLDALMRSPHAGKLEILRVGLYGDPDLLVPLVRSPHLQNVRALEVNSWGRGLELGTLGDAFGGLELLILSGNFARFEPLFAGRGLERLTDLRIANCGLRDEGFAALAESPLLSRLATLDASNNPLTDMGADALAAAAPRTRLAVLDVRDNQLTARGRGELFNAFPDTRVLVGSRLPR